MKDKEQGETTPQIMTADERVMLLDAAMLSWEPEIFLDLMQDTFDLSDRQNDALTTSTLRWLLRNGEIELVMHLRAE